MVEAAKVGLEINEQKTGYMIADGNRTILDVGQTVVFGDKNFEVVNEFVYLEALVTLLVFERKVLRTIFGPNIVNGVYRSRYNFELDREFNSPNVIGVVKSNKLRHAGHMIRGAEGPPQRALFIRSCRKADGTKQDRNPGERMT
jgi:hypothetical protein